MFYFFTRQLLGNEEQFCKKYLKRNTDQDNTSPITHGYEQGLSQQGLLDSLVHDKYLILVNKRHPRFWYVFSYKYFNSKLNF